MRESNFVQVRPYLAEQNVPRLVNRSLLLSTVSAVAHSLSEDRASSGYAPNRCTSASSARSFFLTPCLISSAKLTERSHFPTFRHAFDDFHLFVAGEAKADEPFAVDFLGQLFQ